MTQPNPDQSGQDKPPADKPKGSPKLDVLTVGTYEFDDQAGGLHKGVGVVIAVDQVLTVAPVELRYLQVDPANFTPLTADDV